MADGTAAVSVLDVKPPDVAPEAGPRFGHALGQDRELAAIDLVTAGMMNGDVALVVAQAEHGAVPTVLYVNDAFLRLTGYPLEEVLGRSCNFLRGPDSAADVLSEFDNALKAEIFCDIDVLHYRRDGTPFWNGMTVSPLRDACHRPGAFMLFMRDVTARHRADERMAALADRLRDLAMSDPLTGIANRRSFDAMLEREWRRAERLGGHTTLAMVDIDYFKAFNDRYGHPAGDACLRAVVEALQGVIRRPTDFIARYGGEEFAILLPDIAPEHAAEIGQRMVDAVRDAAVSDACSPSSGIRISCGVISAMPARCAGGPAHFLAQADSALYEAKTMGRDRMHHLIMPQG